MYTGSSNTPLLPADVRYSLLQRFEELVSCFFVEGVPCRGWRWGPHSCVVFGGQELGHVVLEGPDYRLPLVEFAGSFGR